MTLTSIPSSTQLLASVYGQRIVAALPLMWARSVSLHDRRGQAYWETGDAFGPAEREAVRAALESFVGQSAPARTNQRLSGHRTAVLLRAADEANQFRGFVVLIVDDRRLRSKGYSALDLPVPVVRAVNEWGVRLGSSGDADVADSAPAMQSAAASASTTPGSVVAVTAAEPAPVDNVGLADAEVDEMLSSPTVDDEEVDRFLAQLRAFPIALATQRLAPLQSGIRIRRHEVFLRSAETSAVDRAPEALLREAEQRGLGDVLDRRVLGALIVWLSQRNDIWTTEPTQFSINLSATALRDPNFPKFVELCLAKAKLAAGSVAFEVDQSVCRAQRRRIEQLAATLDACGACLVIDNFSLHEESVGLLMLPGVRLVKIDRALTKELASDRTAQVKVTGIAHIARSAGVHTVAKQVDSGDEQAMLQALGVDFAQGFGIASPESIEAWDAKHEAQVVVDPAVAEPVVESEIPVVAEPAASVEAAVEDESTCTTPPLAVAHGF